MRGVTTISFSSAAPHYRPSRTLARRAAISTKLLRRSVRRTIRPIADGMRQRLSGAAIRWFGAEARTPPNMRIYAIGDIHGRADLLQSLMVNLEADVAARPRLRTQLVILGDFIDRGRDSALVAHLLMGIDQSNPSVTVLMGNHEATLLDVLRGDDYALLRWLDYGGRAALESWGIEEKLIDPDNIEPLVEALHDALGPEMITWFAGLPRIFRCGDYAFVHAGIRPGRSLSRQSSADLMWIREPFLSHPKPHGCVVVHGHTVVEGGPQFLPNRIAVDAGAWRTGLLCAVGLEGTERWAVCS